MGQYLPPDSTQVSQMDAALAQLRQALLSYQTQLGTATSGPGGWLTSLNNWVTDNTSQDAAEGAGRQWAAQIDKLGGVDYQAVLAGEQSLQGWFGTANAIRDSLASTGADLSSWTFSGIVSQTASQTATDVKHVAEIGALVSLPIIIAIAVVYLLIVFGGRK